MTDFFAAMDIARIANFAGSQAWALSFIGVAAPAEREVAVQDLLVHLCIRNSENAAACDEIQGAVADSAVWMFGAGHIHRHVCVDEDRLSKSQGGGRLS